MCIRDSHKIRLTHSPFPNFQKKISSTPSNLWKSFFFHYMRLGKASKYLHRVTPMPINRVPIFSDSVSIGTDFIGTDWNGIGNGSITDIINSWLISVSVYQRNVIVSHATLLTKICWATLMSTKAKHKWLSFQCTNRLGMTNWLQLGLTAEYPSTNLHKNSVYCILTRSSKNAAKFKQ